jgi:hypothetical protein
MMNELSTNLSLAYTKTHSNTIYENHDLNQHQNSRNQL